MAPGEEWWIDTAISEQTCSGAHVRHAWGLLELLLIKAGVSEILVICNINPLVPLTWLGKTQVIMISARKHVVNKAPTDGSPYLKV